MSALRKLLVYRTLRHIGEEGISLKNGIQCTAAKEKMLMDVSLCYFQERRRKSIKIFQIIEATNRGVTWQQNTKDFG